MSTNFRVRNLIADNAVYNTGNQTISGVKKFDSVIDGNIKTVQTGSIYANVGTYEHQALVWFPTLRRYVPSHDGLLILHRAGSAASIEKYAEMSFYSPNVTHDVLLNKENLGVDFNINPQGAFFAGSFLKVYASISFTRKKVDQTPNTFEYFHGIYNESFLISHKDRTYTTFDPIYINNTANTVNIVDPVVDQLVGKPANGWVSLVCAGDSLYLRFNSHNLVNTTVYEYSTHIKTYLKNYE